MLIIWGRHRFARKVEAYRNDFCLSCRDVRVAEWVRSFHVGHLYWIPLIPLGTKYEWFCTTCSNAPHARAESSQGFKRLVAGFFTLLALFVLVMAVIATTGNAPEIANRSDAPVTWLVFLGAAGVAALAIYWATRMLPAPNLGEMLAQVPMLSTTECLYCKGALTADGDCAVCQVRHDPLRAD